MQSMPISSIYFTFLFGSFNCYYITYTYIQIVQPLITLHTNHNYLENHCCLAIYFSCSVVFHILHTLIYMSSFFKRMVKN